MQYLFILYNVDLGHQEKSFRVVVYSLTLSCMQWCTMKMSMIFDLVSTIGKKYPHTSQHPTPSINTCNQRTIMTWFQSTKIDLFDLAFIIQASAITTAHNYDDSVCKGSILFLITTDLSMKYLFVWIIFSFNGLTIWALIYSSIFTPSSYPRLKPWLKSLVNWW